MQLVSAFQATNFCPFGSGQKSRLETHHVIYLFRFHHPLLVLIYCNDDQWVNLWFCLTLFHSTPHETIILEHGGWKSNCGNSAMQARSIAGSDWASWPDPQGDHSWLFGCPLKAIFFSTWNKSQLEIRGTGKNWGFTLDSTQFKYPFACFHYNMATAIFKMALSNFKFTRLQLALRGAEQLKCEAMQFW